MVVSREFATNVERLATPGIPAPAQFERLVFSPVDPSELVISSDVSGFLCRSMYQSDIALAQDATLRDGEGLLTRKITAYEAQKAQNDILTAIYVAVEEDPTVRVIGLLNGILPAFKTLWDADTSLEYRSRLEAKRISGYSQDTANPVVMEGSLAPENKTASLVIVLDDIVDSAHEQAAIKYALELLRGKTPHPERVQELQHAAETDFSESSALYDDVVREFREAGIVIASTVYKNIPFKRSLERLLEECSVTDSWATVQQAVLSPAIELKQTDWVMGTCMDSDVLGSQLEGEIRDVLADEMDDELSRMIGIISRQKFRIGGFIEGLVSMNRSDKTDLIRAVAKNFAGSLREWKHVGYRWEWMYTGHTDDPSDWARDLLSQLS